MLTALRNFNHWDLILWGVLLLAGLGLELLGLLHKRDATFTYLVRTYVPVWTRAMVLGWLSYHFLISPTNR